MTQHSIPWPDLKHHAQHAMQRAYAPYSSYVVGAAVYGDDGSITSGCNVENASYGLSLCAERNAIAAAVHNGMKRAIAIAIACNAPGFATPCGACRQVINEFGPDCAILCINRHAQEFMSTLGELLPHAFGPHNLTETT